MKRSFLTGVKLFKRIIVRCRIRPMPVNRTGSLLANRPDFARRYIHDYHRKRVRSNIERVYSGGIDDY